MGEILSAISWELWVVVYLFIGIVWGVIERIRYPEYDVFEFLLCTFLWLLRIVVWLVLLLFLGVSKVFDWSDK